MEYLAEFSSLLVVDVERCALSPFGDRVLRLLAEVGVLFEGPRHLSMMDIREPSPWPGQ